MKSERNSKTSGISDFESLHPTKKNFEGRGSAGNRFFGAVRFGGFRPGREISSPAGRSRARPARSRSRFSRSGEISRDFQKKKTFSRKFEENIKISKGFSTFWEDFGRIPLPRAWISLDFLLIFYWFLLISLISIDFIDFHQVRGPAD